MTNASTLSKHTNNVYRAVWRWHFYAGLIVAPFLLILAVTGTIYLFEEEINDSLYPKQRFVEQTLPNMPVSHLMQSALSQYPGGSVTRVYMPTEAGRSAVVFVTNATGEAWRLYMDTGTAQVLGTFQYTSTLVGFADVFHGSLLMGDFGDGIVELMACWTIVLLITGLYLWWPKSRFTLKGNLLPQLGFTGRLAWKNWHRSIGLWSLPLILFLVMTGLPWSTNWGDYFRGGIEKLGVGYPKNYRLHGATPNSETLGEVFGEVPWTLENEPMPQSDLHAEHQSGAHGLAPEDLAQGIGVDKAVEILEEVGIDPAYRLMLPLDTSGTYMAYTYPGKPESQRSVHIDQYSGKVLGDVSFKDYGWAAKAIELGVQLHMGNYFGIPNQIIMLLACMGTITLAISGPIMWWKRRPKGSLGIPAEISPVKMRNITLITAALALALPLAGASLVAVLIVDWLFGVWKKRTAPLASRI